MGQYYRAVCLDKEEYVSPYDYGSGAKLMEHSWLRNDFVNAVVSLLFTGGRWCKTRFVWTGDYSEQKHFVKKTTTRDYAKYYAEKEPEYAVKYPENLKPNLYDLCMDEHDFEKPPYFRKFFAPVIPAIPDSPTRKTFHFIVNHTKKEYVNIYVCPKDGDGWIIHPLPLLTCDSFDGGGSHDKDANRYCGVWTGDVIEVVSERPSKDFTEIHPDFIE
jgi:hypothetical protein